MSSLCDRIQALLRDGLSQREVAKRIGCSKGTVYKHRAHDLLARAAKGRQGALSFPVHPDVEAIKTQLLAAFVAGRDTGPLRRELETLLHQHHPRDQRHPDQLEATSHGQR